MEEFPPPAGRLRFDLNLVAGIMERLRAITSKPKPLPPRPRHRIPLQPALDALANILTTTENHYSVGVVHAQAEPSYEIWLAEDTAINPSTCPSSAPSPSPTLIEASIFTRSLMKQLAVARQLNIDAIHGGDLRFPQAFLQPLPSLNIKGISPLVHSMFERMWPRFIQVFAKNEDLQACCKVANFVTSNTSHNIWSNPTSEDMEHHINVLKARPSAFHSGRSSISEVVDRLSAACKTPWPENAMRRQDILWDLAALSSIHRVLCGTKTGDFIESWNFLSTAVMHDANPSDPLRPFAPISILKILGTLVSMFDDMNEVLRIVLLPLSISALPPIRYILSHFNEPFPTSSIFPEEPVSQILSSAGVKADATTMRKFIGALDRQQNKRLVLYPEVTLLMAMYRVPAFPYIGIHQPPGPATQTLFQAFCMYTEVPIRLREGEASSEGWCFPSLSSFARSVHDARLRRDVYEDMRMQFWIISRENILRDWRKFCT
ncbi:hypothetical protein DL93DRAFT_2088424, partial [Clavulina sp. PMI_390]